MTLEKRLQELAARGDLNYISVVPVAGKTGVEFSACFRASSGEYTRAVDPDPAAALEFALDAYENILLEDVP